MDTADLVYEVSGHPVHMSPGVFIRITVAYPYKTPSEKTFLFSLAKVHIE